MRSKGQIRYWAKHGLIKRGPFWLLRSKAKVKSLIIPLLEDQSPPGAVEEPVQELVFILRSSRHGDEDISTRWGDYLFWSVQEDEIAVQGGEIKFMLLQGKEDETAEGVEAEEPDADGREAAGEATLGAETVGGEACGGETGGRSPTE